MCQFQSTIARHNSKRRIALMLELTLLAVDLHEGRRVGLQVEMIGLDLVGHPREGKEAPRHINTPKCSPLTSPSTKKENTHPKTKTTFKTRTAQKNTCRAE